MRSFLVVPLLALILFAGCAGEQPMVQEVVVRTPVRQVGYLHDVKPILDSRCVVCHSCYNSPCQLKLSSFAGLDRGATKNAVYNSKRLFPMEPTRLFTDADSTAEWRDKGFHSVTGSSSGNNRNNSLLLRLLGQKNAVRQSSGSYSPEEDELTCAENSAELDDYLRKHPNRGMPYGFPPLTEKEYQVVADWLALGAPGPGPQEQKALEAVAVEDLEGVSTWEEFFNRQQPKNVMTARYLYEHLFLAHISFTPSGSAFYELVRSRTPPGEPIDLITTVRPYDDPGVDRFYYRFRRITSTIVHKTHMVFELSGHTLERIHKLFIEPDWLEDPHVMAYDAEQSANPFAVFEQIPPSSRYQFLLDNAHYIIMTFIRGPVCKGQVALNSIHDHFWLFFLDPEYDLAVKHPGFLQEHLDYLDMPVEQGSFFSLFKSWRIRKYRRDVSSYVAKRQEYYSLAYRFRGLGPGAIWPGDDSRDTPALTVFRHFNSASVHKGVLGELPRTVWVMDYPLLERIYYALVAGFDVFGSMGHQLAVRVYMDSLRQEAETYFLNFLPQKSRRALMQEWYGGIDVDSIDYHDANMAAGYPFTTDNPKRELVEYLVRHHLNPATAIDFDENYLFAGEHHPQLPERYSVESDYIEGFHAASSPSTSFFNYVHDHNANLAYVRIKISEQKSKVVSMVVHRWHDDLRTMHSEEDKLDPSKDQADFIPGFVGSYPNYFFIVELGRLPDFLRLLKEYDGSPEAIERIAEFGVNRADDDFWDHYDWFQQQFLASDRLRAGLFDLNRYYHKALEHQ